MPQFKVLFVLCLEIIFNSKWSCVMACSFHSFFNFSNSRKFIVNSCFRVHMCICMFKDCLLIVYCVLRWFFPCLVVKLYFHLHPQFRVMFMFKKEDVKNQNQLAIWNDLVSKLVPSILFVNSFNSHLKFIVISWFRI